MRPIGPGIRTRRKRWFLAVAGSRTGHPLQGKVSGGMTLAVFTCRGRPAALNRATLRRYGSLWYGSSLGGFPPGCSTPACACRAFCNRAALCHTLAVPLAVPLLQGFGTCQGNSRAASPAHGASQPALRESLRLRMDRGSGRHLEMGRSCSFVSNEAVDGEPGIRRRPPLFGNRRRQSHLVLEPRSLA